MNEVDEEYQRLIHLLLEKGRRINTRNSYTKRLIKYDLRFTSTPLVTVQKTAWKSSLFEFEWFLSGSNRIEDLHQSVRHWWQPWVNDKGEIPFNYSKQFREFHGTPRYYKTWDDLDEYEIEPNAVDQIQLLVDGVRDHPFSRRNLISSWQSADMVRKECPITNCHSTVLQAFVEPDNSLHTVTYQRSCDVVVGLRHNLIQQWGFLLWLAHRTGTTPGSLSWTGGDVHLYEQHTELAERIRGATDELLPTPQLVYRPTSSEFKADDFSLDGEYRPLITDRAEMVV